MGIPLITLGLFLWFTLTFNGSVGTDFVDRSFFLSGLFMIVAGAAIIWKLHWNYVRVLCAVALVSYLPMVWQRFNFRFGVNWFGFGFDICIAIFLLFLITKKFNKSHESGSPQSGEH